MSELSDEIRLNDILWVDVEGYNEEAVWVGCYRPATTAEIMASHPKCGECKYFEPFDDWDGRCTNSRSTSDDKAVIADKDYCRHWEGKE